MKLLLLLFSIPFLFISCFVSVFGDTDPPETDGSKDAPEEETSEDTDNEDEARESQEITPVDITSDVFISNFFSGNYDYKNVSLFSSYEYMTSELGEPVDTGDVIDGTYYSYGPIAFNFPVSVDENSEDAQVDGIIIFPEDFYKMDAVEHYGWPTFDEPGNFRMFYDGDTENGYYIMLTYDRDDAVTSLVLHNKNLQDTDFYE